MECSFLINRFKFFVFFLFHSKTEGHSAALSIEKPTDSTNQRKNQQVTQDTRTNDCDKNSKNIASTNEWTKNKATHDNECAGNEKTYSLFAVFFPLIFFFFIHLENSKIS